MKKFFQYIACIALLGISSASCSDDEGITPLPVTNLHYDTTPGRIVLRWETPADGNIRYVQVNYYDPLQKQEVMCTASAYADSLEIAETRQKYGEYRFTVKSVSTTEDRSEEQTLTAVSAPAPKTWTPVAMKLNGDMLSTNAQEPSEGPIANLVDDNTSTFFHTAWSVDIPGPHYIIMNLPETVDQWWQFYYAPRANGNNKPTDFDLEGSMDGNTWFLIKNFTKDADKLPTDAQTAFTSQRMNAEEQPFKYLKFTVNETNSGSTFWTMSEFKVYIVNLIDPEASDEK